MANGRQEALIASVLIAFSSGSAVANPVYEPSSEYRLWIYTWPEEPTASYRDGTGAGSALVDGDSRGVAWNNLGETLEFSPLGFGRSYTNHSWVYDESLNSLVGASDKYVESAHVGVRAVRWDTAANPTELGILGIHSPTNSSYEARGVNRSGATVGNGWVGRINRSGPHAIRWDAGSTTAVDLGPGIAQFINDSGVIAGRTGSGPGRWAPMSTTPTYLQYEAGAGYQLTGINEAGTIVGSIGYRQPVRWDADSTQLTKLSTLSAQHVGGVANAINDNGVIVGASVKYDGNTSLGMRAVKWAPGSTTPTELENVGTSGNSEAVAVNRFGVAVGFRYANISGPSNSVELRATLWREDGTLIDLNDHFPWLIGATDWMLTKARSISDTGWVTGYGRSATSGNEYARLFLIDTFFLTGTPGDATRDGTVDFDDLLAVSYHYGTTTGGVWNTGDFDGDGAVSFDDLLDLAQHYQVSSPDLQGLSADFQAEWRAALSLAPEPAGLSLLAGITACVRRRKPETAG